MLSFSVSVLCLTLITYLLGWKSSLSINIVVLVHLFLQAQPFTASLIFNEVLRVFIGVSIALLVNRRMSTRETEFLNDKIQIEACMQFLLKQYAGVIRKQDAEEEQIPETLTRLEESIESGTQNATSFANNELSETSQYYLKYIAMRRAEALILKDVYAVIAYIQNADPSVPYLSAYLEVLSRSVSVEQPLKEAGEAQQTLQKSLDEEALPKTKEELQDRSAVFFIKQSLEEMISNKQEFIASLSEEEKKRYWQDYSAI